MILAPAEMALLQAPREEEPVGVPTPSEPTVSEPQEAAQPKDFTLIHRRRPMSSPGFTLLWVGKSGSPPSREGGLAHECTSGSPSGFCLLGLPANDHITLSSDGHCMMLVPVPDHCPDVPGPDVPKLALPKPP